MKIIITILFFIFSVSAYSQFSPIVPMGSPSTENRATGAIGTLTGFVYDKNWTDTTAANANLFVKGMPGIAIRVSDTLIYLRNSTANKWVLISGGSGGGGSGVTAANNGLTLSGSTVQLGGTGIQNTTIAWGAFTQGQSWTNFGANTGLTLTGTGTSSGNTNTIFKVARSGATSISQNTYGAWIENTTTGTGGSTVGLRLKASGKGANSYALLIDTGFVCIGCLIPSSPLSVITANVGLSEDYNTGIVMSTGTHATAILNQNSPTLSFGGSTWITNSGGSAVPVDFNLYVVGATGAAAPTARLELAYSNELVGQVDVIAFGNAGQLYLGSSLDPGTSGQIMKSNGASAAPSWINQSSIVGAVPTLQQVFGAQSNTAIMTGDNTITLGTNNSFFIERSGSGGFAVLDGVTSRIGVGSSSTTTASPNGNERFSVTDAGHYALGLNAGTTNSRIVGIDSDDDQLGYLTNGLGISITSGVLLADTTILVNKANAQVLVGIKNFTNGLNANTSITTASTTLAVFNTTATTVNAFGAATTLNIGNSSGKTFFSGQVKILAPQAGSTDSIATWKDGFLSATLASALPFINNGATSTLTASTLIDATTSFRLDISAGSSSKLIRIAGTTGLIHIGDPEGNDLGTTFTTDEANSTFTFDNTAHTALVGINTSTPTVALDVVGQAKISLEANVAGDLKAATSGTYTTYLFLTDVINGVVDVGAANGEGNSTRYRVDDVNQQIRFYNSSASIIIDALSAGGAVTAGAGTGTLSVVSDGRLKHDISPYQFGLKEILQTNPITFRYNEDQKMGNSLYAGFDARDIYKIYGSLGAGTDSKGYHSLFDKALIAANINATKELYQIVVDLKVEFENYKRTHP